MNVDTGVYSITNVVNGKRYIGSAMSFVYRWKKHRSELRTGVHHCEPLLRAWKKYGEHSFVFEKIALCPITDLLAIEQSKIIAFNPEYNICKLAGSNLGIKRNQETLLKMSASQKGKPRSQEQRAQIAATLKGRYGGGKNPAARKVVCIETGQTFPSCLDAALWAHPTGRSKSGSAVGLACSGKINSAYGYAWKYDGDPDKPPYDPDRRKGHKSHNARKVVCVETGREFATMDDAASWLSSIGFPKAKGPAIGTACAGKKKKTAYGYTWRLSDGPEKESLAGKTISRGGSHYLARSVICMESGSSFPSMADAVRWLRANGFQKAMPSALTSVCSGRGKVAYGFHWKYAN